MQPQNNQHVAKQTPIKQLIEEKSMQLFDPKAMAELAKLKSADSRNYGVMSLENVKKVMEKIQKTTSAATPEEAFALVTMVIQRGGTNTNTGIRVEASLNSAKLNAETLKNICKSEGQGTVRAFARAINNEIAQVAGLLQEPGDLARKFKRDFPSATDEELIWCSNYQSENASCPEKVRIWLVQDYKRRFNQESEA